jgi:hypothetical protein
MSVRAPVNASISCVSARARGWQGPRSTLLGLSQLKPDPLGGQENVRVQAPRASYIRDGAGASACACATPQAILRSETR